MATQRLFFRWFPHSPKKEKIFGSMPGLYSVIDDVPASIKKIFLIHWKICTLFCYVINEVLFVYRVILIGNKSAINILTQSLDHPRKQLE